MEKGPKKINEKSAIDISSLGSEYAVSKYMCEQLIKYYCKIFRIKYVILRFGIIYGPRSNASNWSAVETLINKLLLKEKIVVGSKKQLEDLFMLKM